MIVIKNLLILLNDLFMVGSDKEFRILFQYFSKIEKESRLIIGCWFYAKMISLVQNLELVVGSCEAELTERVLFLLWVLMRSFLLQRCRIFSVNFSFIDVMYGRQ